MCIIISCTSKYALESISQNIRDVYECRSTGCKRRIPSVGGGYPLESTSQERRYDRTSSIG